ncbi:similar to Saccharomyces cerevisiae YGR235C Putative protein of unknown function [Maudiozyma barnettii]|uniref:MICOS complex subunit n=1 Tax=Maudiozyma barnettii TaxID=61262 RepID=A0A8H2ZJL9_9SACH|nr:uncharacterized protein KABA2_08S03564 [Kazachstania barnettii]CAB4256113.1 similar to Saccharomyces cerevisiae YGR235C Putative protein of unknown function [Kazachstania barnettii]CAD1784721.1 similar to Saccharomyces cerevisiae YGR235C Putative protein of unknown function [Kazachstania barnettii]
MSKDFYREVDPASDKLIVDRENDSLQQQPEKLTTFIRDQRLKIADGVEDTKQNVDKIKNKYNEAENKVNSKISNVYADDRNKLGLGVASMVVATMTGSIMSRRAGRSMKLITPLLLGIFTGMYVFPRTAHNVCDRVYDYELKHFPVLANKQREIKGELNEGLQDCRDFSRKFRKMINEWF